MTTSISSITPCSESTSESKNEFMPFDDSISNAFNAMEDIIDPNKSVMFKFVNGRWINILDPKYQNGRGQQVSFLNKSVSDEEDYVLVFKFQSEFVSDSESESELDEEDYVFDDCKQ